MTAPQSPSPIDEVLPGARQRYRQQRNNAAARDVPWHFTFETWVAAWLESGKWDQRGFLEDGTVGYVMGRHGDVGPYSPENTYIITASENAKEARRLKPTKRGIKFVGIGKGWHFRPEKSKRNPYEVTCMGKYIGLYATEAEARQAYLDVVAKFFASQEEQA